MSDPPRFWGSVFSYFGCVRVLKFVRGDSYIAGVVGQVCARSQNKQNKPATKQKHLPKIGGRSGTNKKNYVWSPQERRRKQTGRSASLNGFRLLGRGFPLLSCARAVYAALCEATV